MNINYIVEEIDNEEYLFWFEESNKYLTCNLSIFNLLQNEIKRRHKLQNIDDISKNLPKIESEIKNLLDELLRPVKKNKHISSKLSQKEFTINKNYKFNNKVLKFSFENKSMLELVHPKFEHLECKNEGKKNFKICREKELISFFIDDRYVGGYNKNQMHELQGKISMEMTSFFYNKKEDDWIGVFHGSTLNKGNKSIMLTGESGSGKSSLTLILSSNGFSLVADDFSPISNDMKHYKFPAAISVKKGFYDYANKLSKDFLKKKEYLVDKNKGKFKYYSLDIDDRSNSHNCNYIIDVKYGKHLKNNISMSTKGKALQKLLPESWLSRIFNNSKKFYQWIHNSNFYELTYNDNKKAIELINNIF